MRILMVTNLYAPDECGGAQTITDLAEALAARGHEVTVRTAYPYYPEWRDKSGRNGLAVRREGRHGVAVERYGLHIPGRPGRLTGRALQEGSFFLSLARSLPRGRHDVALVYCPLMGAVAFGALHRLLRRTPALLCVQDLPVEAAVIGGILAGGLLARLLGGAQHWLFGRYSAWRSIHRVMAEQLASCGGRRVFLIPDWLHLTLARAIASLPPRSERPAGNPLRLLYSGNVGGKQGLPDFCRMLRKCRIDFSFRINGAGGGMTQLREVVDSDQRLVLGELTTEAEFARALHWADLYVVTELPAGAPFFPSKTIPSMAAGTPILAVSNKHSPLGVEMRTHGLGPWLPWERVGELEALLGAITPEALARWRTAALERSRYYERNRCIDRFEEALLAVATGRSLPPADLVPHPQVRPEADPSHVAA